MRIRAVVLLTTLVAPMIAATAYAGPATNEQDVTTKVAGQITELRVDGDVSNVKLTPGNASVVKAHLEWVMSKPELSVSASKGVLTVKVRCNDEINVGMIQRDCNYLQAIEGEIDTAHFGYLHGGRSSRCGGAKAERAVADPGQGAEHQCPGGVDGDAPPLVCS